MADDLTHFKVHAGIKDIIGNELITDDFVAVFELVKNSFDAHAKRVVVRFENLRQPDLSKTRLIIMDDGKGMTREDIRDKWLWVGFSAKKNDTEDTGLANDADYRTELGAKKAFAGAKGIGRFSCDRLGRYLNLYTRRNATDPNLECLMVDWRDFEAGERVRFEQVEIEHDEVTQNPFGLGHGTVLEISGLRKVWTREDLQLLRKELQKLIVPEEGGSSPTFEIVVEVPDELSKDKSSDKKKGDPVNGPVRNFLFEKLGLKTTQIVCSFTPSGKFIETRLLDQNRLIYRLVEENADFTGLAGVTFRVFYLNRAAKLAFNTTIGVAPIEFGSVFVYKNGFRVQPYGREDDDSFGIDRRKVQGTSRFLGNRDICGRIEIKSDNSRFKEASSRNAGFIESSEVVQLTDYYRHICLRRLELYVVDVLKWGNDVSDTMDASKPNSAPENQDALLKLVTKLTDSKEVANFEVGKDLIKIVSASQATGAKALMKNFERLASTDGNANLAKEARRIRIELEDAIQAKEEAEEAEKKERERAKKAEDEVQKAYSKASAAEDAAKSAIQQATEAQDRERQVVTQNVFLRAALSHDLDHLMKLHHTIGQDAGVIETFVRNLFEIINAPGTIKPESIRVPLERISFRAARISSITKFATRANHVAASEHHTGDLIEYVREYLANVYGGHVTALATDEQKIPIIFKNSGDSNFYTSFTPLDVCVVFDNLLSNARKHGCTEIMVSSLQCDEEKLIISFRDNGKGVPKKSEGQLFKPGFSTTEGSGLGLCHMKEIMEELGGDIAFHRPDGPGAEFLLTFPKNEN
jgi:signal transduction histidine kinase